MESSLVFGGFSRPWASNSSPVVRPFPRLRLVLGLLPSAFLALSAVAAGDYTRGVGVYPGDPASFDGPTEVLESATYRNLALHRPASASRNYDYSLTAQLVTDGIIDSRL